MVAGGIVAIAMGTHYDTLGVKPGSTTQEIRKAYLRRARALHPDRQQGRAPAEARQAEQAMQQVNVAWNVLSDPTKKQEYDKSLTSPRSGASRSPARPTQTPRAQAPRVQASPSREPSGAKIDETPGDGSVSVWASMPVLLVLGLLLGILILTAFAGRGNDEPVRQEDTATLSVDDCFQLVGDAPRERSCNTGVADGLVIEIGPAPGNCPTDTMSLRDPRTNFFICWKQLVPGTSNTVP